MTKFWSSNTVSYWKEPGFLKNWWVPCLQVSLEHVQVSWRQLITAKCKKTIIPIVVQSLNHARHFATANCTMPGFSVLHYLPEFTLTHVHWACEAIQPSHSPSAPSYPALNLFQHQGLFQWVSSSHQVAKIWSFSFSISNSNEYSGLISFRTDWFDLLAVQGKGLLQYHNSKASILWHSVFFMVQLT